MRKTPQLERVYSADGGSRDMGIYLNAEDKSRSSLGGKEGISNFLFVARQGVFRGGVRFIMGKGWGFYGGCSKGKFEIF